MTYLLDTNICIRYLNGRSERVRLHFEAARSQDVVLCSIVKAELIYGTMKSANPEINLNKLQRFADRFVSLPFDDKAATEYGQMRAQLEKQGTPIGPNDLCIAAFAKANEVTLVTHNTREFSRVEGLMLEDWEIA